MATDIYTLSPPNSLLLLKDRDVKDLPDYQEGELVSAAGACIAIGTYSCADGTTQVEVRTGTDAAAGNPGLPKVWGGSIQVPSDVVCLETVFAKMIGACGFRARCSIELFANDTVEPQRLIMLLRSPDGLSSDDVSLRADEDVTRGGPVSFHR